MKFFTTYYVEKSRFCLANISDYLRQDLSKKELIFIDPQISNLLKHSDYLNINKLHELAQPEALPNNQYISIDYPSDMFPERTAEFIERTNQNNERYGDNPQYITTIQYHLSMEKGLRADGFWAKEAEGKISDFESFKREFERNKPFFFKRKKILGIGNMCRILNPNQLTDKIFHYIIQQHRGNSLFKNEKNLYWVHFYGLAKRLILKYVPLLEYNQINVSVDSTKWTIAGLKLQKKYNFIHQQQVQFIDDRKKRFGKCGGWGVPSEITNEFFITYMNDLSRRIKVEY